MFASNGVKPELFLFPLIPDKYSRVDNKHSASLTGKLWLFLDLVLGLIVEGLAQKGNFSR